LPEFEFALQVKAAELIARSESCEKSRRQPEKCQAFSFVIWG